MFALLLQAAQQPELPGSIEAAPFPWAWWLLLATGAVVLVHGAWKRRRSGIPRTPEAEDGLASTMQELSFAEALATLRRSLDSLSSDQRREALALSALMRRAAGEVLGSDCTAWTTAQLNTHAESPGLEASSFVATLEFAADILYAGSSADPAQWHRRLDRLDSWLPQLGEEVGDA